MINKNIKLSNQIAQTFWKVSGKYVFFLIGCNDLISYDPETAWFVTEEIFELDFLTGQILDNCYLWYSQN